MDMPEMTRLLGMFPLKYGCFLISLFGLGFGGILMAAIILYGIAENIILRYFDVGKIDENSKKAILMPMGIASLMMLLSNTVLFFGVTLKRVTYIAVASRVMLAMCIILLIMAVSAPLTCFYSDGTCLIKESSLLLMLAGFMILTLFVQIWLYNSAACWNLEQTMT